MGKSQFLRLALASRAASEDYRLLTAGTSQQRGQEMRKVELFYSEATASQAPLCHGAPSPRQRQRISRSGL